jgi:hypothetical protein
MGANSTDSDRQRPAINGLSRSIDACPFTSVKLPFDAGISDVPAVPRRMKAGSPLPAVTGLYRVCPMPSRASPESGAATGDLAINRPA